MHVLILCVSIQTLYIHIIYIWPHHAGAYICVSSCDIECFLCVRAAHFFMVKRKFNVVAVKILCCVIVLAFFIFVIFFCFAFMSFICWRLYEKGARCMIRWFCRVNEFIGVFGVSMGKLHETFRACVRFLRCVLFIQRNPQVLQHNGVATRYEGRRKATKDNETSINASIGVTKLATLITLTTALRLPFTNVALWIMSVERNELWLNCQAKRTRNDKKSCSAQREKSKNTANRRTKRSCAKWQRQHENGRNWTIGRMWQININNDRVETALFIMNDDKRPCQSCAFSLYGLLQMTAKIVEWKTSTTYWKRFVWLIVGWVHSLFSAFNHASVLCSLIV